MILRKLWNEIEAVSKYKRRLQGMIRLLLNERVINSYIISMNYPDFGGRHTGWTFPFSNLRSLESWNISISRVSLTCSIYATAAKTGVTLMQKEYHQYLGGELSLKNCLILVSVAYMRSQTQNVSQIYCHLSHICVYLCKYAYECVAKTWLFSVMSVEKGSTLFTP